MIYIPCRLKYVLFLVCVDALADTLKCNLITSPVKMNAKAGDKIPPNVTFLHQETYWLMTYGDPKRSPF